MIDLKWLMERVGALFAKELRENIQNQVDINGSPFVPVKTSTAIGRQRRSNRAQKIGRAKGVKGKVRGTVKVRAIKDHLGSGLVFTRLLFTRKFYQNAFKSLAGRDFVRVFTNSAYYQLGSSGSLVSYTDIIRYNNLGSPLVNRDILKPPLVFPNSSVDVQKMKAWQLSTRLLLSPTTRSRIVEQMAAQGFKKTIVTLSV